jgi:uncharacterized spore protein YtfJ
MRIQELLQSVGESLARSATVRNVYGDPIVAGDRTVLPAARVRYAFGGGGGSGQSKEQEEEASGGGGGGGGRVVAWPCGALEVTPHGTRYIDFDNRRAAGIALALGFALGAAAAAWAGIGRRR